MKEAERNTVKQSPAKLKPQDRLFLEMLVIIDGDGVEAQIILNKYGVVVPEGVSPLELCQQWFRSIKDAEKRGCQNILDLRSQGKL